MGGVVGFVFLGGVAGLVFPVATALEQDSAFLLIFETFYGLPEHISHPSFDSCVLQDTKKVMSDHGKKNNVTN